MFSIHFTTVLLFHLVSFQPWLLHSAPTEKFRNVIQQTASIRFYVFPHGGITLNPETQDFSEDGGAREGSKESAIRLHDGMASAARDLMEFGPDLVILSTPHGYHLEDRFLFVGNPEMLGNAGWEWSNVSASITIAQDETRHLCKELEIQGNPVELLSFGVGATPMTLQWGEVIPWSFLQNAATQLNIPLPPVIYLGQPRARRRDVLTKFGQDLATHIKTFLAEKKVVLLVSGDLSHYHSNDSRAPYPFHPNSEVFDSEIREWGQISRTPETEWEATAHLLRADSVADTAGSCGLSGIIMMHSVVSSFVEAGSSFLAKFYEYGAPTYFGMMVTSWTPN